MDFLGAYMDGAKIGRGHSPYGGSSHEIIFPYGVDPMYISSSQMSTSQRLVGGKRPDLHMFSAAETASSLTDTASTGLNFTQMACESPLHQLMDGTDPGGSRCGGMSRSSHISSSDVPSAPMQTFKS
ncbi:hypothetical protein GCK32_005219 [Trichostrongylus colubriformis]|uniref:Uncharacterized protein n=1 Tax=Trichostrongylus colubriformis TaxID=6319 RepID=A0AAN8FPN1_TRICO